MPFLTAQWRNLILANYTVEGGVLEPFVPSGVELDTHDGVHFVSLVGFQFIDTRVIGIRWPGLHTFVELNLRFYVKRVMPDGEKRRGVVFIKEIVPSAFIAFVARTLYHEPYERWSIDLIDEFGKDDHYGYVWNNGNQSHAIDVVAVGEHRDLEDGSHEQFIAEHYWGYTRVSDHRTNEYEVLHPSWQFRDLAEHTIRCDFEKVYGPTWSFLSNQEPYPVFLAEGSEISVSSKQRFSK